MAIIDTDEYENFEFFEDAEGKYLAVKDKNAKYEEWMALWFKPVVFDKIRDEILEYVGNLNIATEICDIFNKYKTESEDIE